MYTKGGEESIGGVGFLVHNKIKDHMQEYEGISRRCSQNHGKEQVTTKSSLVTIMRKLYSMSRVMEE
jgi:hypothetical protein